MKKITLEFTCLVSQVQVKPCMQAAIWECYFLLGPYGVRVIPKWPS
jgi:hypothetical protein